MRGFGILLGCGVLFGIGLAVSQMLRQEVVLSFLELRDFGLLVTMGGALLVTAPIYQLAPRVLVTPPCGTAYSRSPRRLVPRTVIGGAVFGVGWGLSGICPGSALASLGAGNWPILIGIGGMLVGAYLQDILLSGAPGSFLRSPADVKGTGPTC